MLRLILASALVAGAAAACTCSSSYPFCWDTGSGHDDYCYKSGTSNEKTKYVCPGECTRSYAPPAPPPPAG
eukprot:gene6956-20333_t